MKKNCPEWLSRTVFYQVYPQSFRDSNGDGIGDIGGIIEKLAYIRWLGCDAIWLNPCFKSPFRDAGYDITDYYRVDRRYGSNADLRRLFKKAAQLGIKVCLDLVAGHSSIDHRRFIKSSSARRNEYSDYYIWTNDWTETAGDRLDCVRGLAQRNGNYLTNFFWAQPALNYGFARPDPKKPWQLPVNHPACRAVRAELIKIMRFWLDMGAAGFRVDMAYNMVKNDPDAVETTKLWRQIRQMLDRDYPQAALISEWFDPKTAIRAGFHVDFLKPPHWQGPYNGTIEQHIAGYLNDQAIENIQKIHGRGYASIISGNHDIQRLSFGKEPRQIELFFAFLMTAPGVPFVYYGDEIGMKYFPDLPSKEGGYRRTGSRTPMQWSSAKNAGFSNAADAKMLYLPIDKRKGRPTVQSQQADKNSLLSSVRGLIGLRRKYQSLTAKGRFTPIAVASGTQPYLYMRSYRAERLLIALNPTGRSLKTKNFPDTPTLLEGRDTKVVSIGTTPQIQLGPYGYGIFTLPNKTTRQPDKTAL